MARAFCTTKRKLVSLTRARAPFDHKIHWQKAELGIADVCNIG